jgi:hypothetical protein
LFNASGNALVNARIADIDRSQSSQQADEQRWASCACSWQLSKGIIWSIALSWQQCASATTYNTSSSKHADAHYCSVNNSSNSSSSFTEQLW